MFLSIQHGIPSGLVAPHIYQVTSTAAGFSTGGRTFVIKWEKGSVKLNYKKYSGKNVEKL